MNKVKLFTHARKIYAGGYKMPQYYTKGGYYPLSIASSLLNLERKEVSACSIHRDEYE